MTIFERVSSIVANVLLLANAILVWFYLQETKQIKQASLDQLEGQIKPVLVPRVNGTQISLVNVGRGPALHVEYWFREVKDAVSVQTTEPPDGVFGYVSRVQEQILQVGIGLMQGSNAKKLYCRYRSGSRKNYLTSASYHSDSMNQPRNFFETSFSE